MPGIPLPSLDENRAVDARGLTLTETEPVETLCLDAAPGAGASGSGGTQSAPGSASAPPDLQATEWQVIELDEMD